MLQVSLALVFQELGTDNLTRRCWWLVLHNCEGTGQGLYKEIVRFGEKSERN